MLYISTNVQFTTILERLFQKHHKHRQHPMTPVTSVTSATPMTPVHTFTGKPELLVECVAAIIRLTESFIRLLETIQSTNVTTDKCLNDIHYIYAHHSVRIQPESLARRALHRRRHPCRHRWRHVTVVVARFSLGTTNWLRCRQFRCLAELPPSTDQARTCRRFRVNDAWKNFKTEITLDIWMHTHAYLLTWTKYLWTANPAS